MPVPDVSPHADTGRMAEAPTGWWARALTGAERGPSCAAEAPAWALTVAGAFAGGEFPPAGAGSWTDDFARIVAPLAGDATRRLDAALAGLPDSVADRASLLDAFTADLSHRLVTLATPVLVLELGRRRERAHDPREGFLDFVDRLATPAGALDLMAGYPVLARLLARRCATAVDTTAELLTRFAADRDRLAAGLLGGARPAVVAVRPGLGDRHRGGRTTSLVDLAGGSRIVYQPRGVAAHLWFTRLVGFVNGIVPGLDLATVAAVSGGDHGWTAFVEPAPLPGAERAGRYHRRLGGLLALAHLMRATDLHYQNLIADGDQPLLVDVETLCHPRLEPVHPDPAVVALGNSVARTGLLPALAGRHGLTDVSGVGGDPGQPTSATITEWADAGTDRMRRTVRGGRVVGGTNRPVLNGLPVEPADHAGAVLAGFGAVHDAIRRHREEFTGLLRAGTDVPVRVVPRPTRHYAAVLADATRPEQLRDMLDVERALRAAAEGPLAEHEVGDLLDGDVPLFTTTPARRQVWASTGVGVPGLVDRSGLDDVLAGLAAVDDFDRRDQQWVVAASLASRRPATGPAPAAAPAGATVAGTDELLAAACVIGDLVMSTALGGDRVNWLGLEPVTDGRFLVLPMGIGLAHGYTGVALFLAQLARTSGVRRYADVARRALTPVPDLLAGLRGQREQTAAVGAGLYGFGGIGYALARLATLSGDAEVAGWARAAVPLAEDAVSLDPDPDWAYGLAGCAAALRAVDEEIGCQRAGDLARHCAGRLTDLTGELDAAAHAVAAVTTPGGPTARLAGPSWWCPDDPPRSTPAPLDRPALRDLTLCHGELGHTDVLAVPGPDRDTDRVAAFLRRRAGTVLAQLRRDGPRCATPDGVPTPGLLTGLAGIGYGLLRLGFPDQVPSVLLLEPTPANH